VPLSHYNHWNPYKQRPGHGGFWKADKKPTHQHRYRITNNVFVAQGLHQGGIVSPVVGYVDECDGNVILWAGPIAGTGGWLEALAGGGGFADGLTDGERLVALNAALTDCLRVVLKPESQTEAEFLDTPWVELGGKSWNQRVAAWVSGKTAPGVAIAGPPDGTTVTVGAAVVFEAGADDTDDGDLSAKIAWSSSLTGPLGSGASLTLTDLSLGTHRVTASVTDSAGLSGNATVTVTVKLAPPPSAAASAPSSRR
jgi:hypothetical protein